MEHNRVPSTSIVHIEHIMIHNSESHSAPAETDVGIVYEMRMIHAVRLSRATNIKRSYAGVAGSIPPAESYARDADAFPRNTVYAEDGPVGRTTLSAPRQAVYYHRNVRDCAGPSGAACARDRSLPLDRHRISAAIGHCGGPCACACRNEDRGAIRGNLTYSCLHISTAATSSVDSLRMSLCTAKCTQQRGQYHPLYRPHHSADSFQREPASLHFYHTHIAPRPQQNTLF